jgi:hypothetical protein
MYAVIVATEPQGPLSPQGKLHAHVHVAGECIQRVQKHHRCRLPEWQGDPHGPTEASARAGAALPLCACGKSMPLPAPPRWSMMHSRINLFLIFFT